MYVVQFWSVYGYMNIARFDSMVEAYHYAKIADNLNGGPVRFGKSTGQDRREFYYRRAMERNEQCGQE